MCGTSIALSCKSCHPVVETLLGFSPAVNQAANCRCYCLYRLISARASKAQAALGKRMQLKLQSLGCKMKTLIYVLPFCDECML